MQTQIISAYLSQDGNVVAICTNSYYVLKTKLDKEKAEQIVDKINSIRMIDTQHWEERR